MWPTNVLWFVANVCVELEIYLTLILQALERISRDCPLDLLLAHSLVAVLSYIDFFGTG